MSVDVGAITTAIDGLSQPRVLCFLQAYFSTNGGYRPLADKGILRKVSSTAFLRGISWSSYPPSCGEIRCRITLNKGVR